MYVFTGGHPDFSAVSQFEEMYGIKPDEQQVSVRHYPLSEHTFPLVASRRQLIDHLVTWYRHWQTKPQKARGTVSVSQVVSPWSLPASPLALV